MSNDTLTSRSVVLRWSPPVDPNGAITMYNISIVVLSNDPIAFMMEGGQGDRRKRQTSGDTNINTNCVEGGQMNVNRILTLIGNRTSHTLTDLSKCLGNTVFNILIVIIVIVVIHFSTIHCLPFQCFSSYQCRFWKNLFSSKTVYNSREW